MRVLVSGVDGQVGSAFADVGAAAGLSILPMRRTDLDLARLDQVDGILDRADPDIIVNCAAYTAVDQAEREAEPAFAVNAKGPEALAGWCARAGRRLIHLSTDYVFAGDATRPYGEDDPTCPMGVYGASKEQGERLVRAACPDHVILRTAWVYAPRGKNFVNTMLRLGRERDELGVVADQQGCPTAAVTIAIAIAAVIERNLRGTYHYVDSGETTWHGLADRIFQRAAVHWGRRPLVKAIATRDYPTPARRPAYSVLDTGKFRRDTGIIPPPWQDSLDQALTEVFAGD